MILTWDTVRGALREWPLYPGERVLIERALLGQDEPEVTGICLLNLSPDQQKPLYIACAPEDVSIAYALYEKRPWVEQQNPDLKSNFLMRILRLFRADRLERMWSFMGLAFYVSYCNEAAQDTAFAQAPGPSLQGWTERFELAIAGLVCGLRRGRKAV